MIPSLSEITATAYKATRGAGLGWGLADEAGRATAWLWEHGIDGPAALAHLLETHEAGCPATTCPIHVGTRLCDEMFGKTGGAPSGKTSSEPSDGPGDGLSDGPGGEPHDEPPTDQLIFTDIQSPVLLLSFAAELAKITKKSYRLSFENALYCASPESMFCAAQHETLTATATLQTGAPIGELLRAVPRREVDRAVWERLNRFAHRTYAPATQASRLAGAGGGVSDND